MGRVLRPVLAALALLGGPGALRGQVPYDGCLDRFGRQIEGVVDNRLGWAGTAAMRNGNPIILWNEKALGTASGPMRLFVYLHECAHHALGHLWKLPSARNEEEADCWAYQLIVDGGIARGRHVDAIEREARLTRGDDIHLGGDARVRSLRRCLRIRTDRAAWRTSLDSLAAASADSFAGLRGKAFPGDPVGVYESLADLPGTFDCEVRDDVFACVVFAARRGVDVRRRFDQLSRIIQDWLPGTWTSITRGDAADARRELHAEDSRSGAGLSLVASADRIAFRFRPRQY
ncbi:MAG TPA: hypothetical protein VLA95_02475 [Gemmatimonadales bacterium]|nr:hypothetical protein [Gemmatimonadales bacterium]